MMPPKSYTLSIKLLAVITVAACSVLCVQGWSAATPRRGFLLGAASAAATWVSSADAKCTDLETCREIGERRDAERLAANPITRLGQGLQYKVIKQGFGEATVSPTSTVDLAYKISQANGSYMYSKGFGFNKIDIGNGQVVPDSNGLDSLRVKLTADSEDSVVAIVPLGIQRAVVGMRKGEVRRIECPPRLGFETSDWNPKPTTFRGQQQIKDYQSTLVGRGPNDPGFPAPTIWDVEIISIR